MRGTERTDARQLRSRRSLNDALLRLLVEMPFDQITIRAISARSGTGYATFFRHYQTKEDLLGDVASAKLEELRELVAPLLTASDAAGLTRALCEFVSADRNLWAALLNGGASGIVREEFIRSARKAPNQLHTRFDWLPDDLAVSFVPGTVVDILGWWLAQDVPVPAEDVAGIMERLIFLPGESAADADDGYVI